jgi:predicted transposase/invertase (TIGR01784 family)
MEALKYISADDEVRAIADLRQKTINDYNSEMTVAREEGKEEGIAIGKEEGIAIGEAKGLREAARSMLAAGIPPETVSHCTKLSIEEIVAIREYTDLT